MSGYAREEFLVCSGFESGFLFLGQLAEAPVIHRIPGLLRLIYNIENIVIHLSCQRIRDAGQRMAVEVLLDSGGTGLAGPDVYQRFFHRPLRRYIISVEYRERSISSFLTS